MRRPACNGYICTWSAMISIRHVWKRNSTGIALRRPSFFHRIVCNLGRTRAQHTICNIYDGKFPIHLVLGIIEELQAHGTIRKQPEDVLKAYLATELTCHKCPSKLSNMPKLKEHIRTHLWHWYFTQYAFVLIYIFVFCQLVSTQLGGKYSRHFSECMNIEWRRRWLDSSFPSQLLLYGSKKKT